MDYLDNLREISIQNHTPIVKDDGRDFLIDFCKKHNPKSILEIGTAVGYSGSFMLMNCDGFLTTIEIDKNCYEFAKQTFEKMGLGNRVNCILGDAKDVIEKLDGGYDFIFLDGPKGQYLAYYERLKELLKSGGYIIADNVYFHGLVNGQEFVKHKLRTLVVNLRKFIDYVKNDKEVECQFFDIADGIALIKKL